MHARRRDTHAEEVGGDVLELVGFVEDDRVVVGQRRAGVRAAQREVGEKKVMVDDHDARCLGLAPHAGDEALAEVCRSPGRCACRSRS